MSDEPSLPRMPPFRAADANFSLGRKRARRNIFDVSGSRNLPVNQLLFNNSSDPAVFSSDDDPALDNYAPADSAGGANRRPWRKNRYIGTWYAQHPESTDSAFDGGDDDGHDRPGEHDEPDSHKGGQSAALALTSSPPQPRYGKKRRTFQRQFDSGVWMHPEATDENDFTMGDPEDESGTKTGISHPRLSDRLPPPAPAKTGFPPLPTQQRRVFQRVPSLAVDSAEQKARLIIHKCIEAGDDKISLIGLGLTALSNATVEPLSGLALIPDVTEGVAFEQNDPKLKIFLSNNSLTRLPGALFQLEHLTVLSVRGNGLTELPPAIGQLRNLKSLNVSFNKLRWLPAELLPLISSFGRAGYLTELLATPNHYLCPDLDSSVEDREYYKNYKKKARHVGDAPTRVARSVVQYMNSWGKTCSQFTLEPEHQTGLKLTATEKSSVQSRPPQAAADTSNSRRSRLPTLVTLALEACYRAPQLGQLPNLLPPEAPLRVRNQLEKALLLRESGGSACAVCSQSKPSPRSMIAPMTAWLEWWEFGKPDINKSSSLSTPTSENPAQGIRLSRRKDEIIMLPFISRGCSWGCLPLVEEAKEETVEEGDSEAEERPNDEGMFNLNGTTVWSS
ncbi:hypothetical protein SEPCBS119000_003582 [Sporothrix epigloea]|uniref:Leucine rich repeat domain containing protein n=1 Tax=Sporothrix epigloea TaxID=1892477 RepID=A0ABP0DMF8_9PEZI